MSLAADPPACTVPAAGGASTRQLANSGTEKLVFKVKSSNNNEYKMKPVAPLLYYGGCTNCGATRRDAHLPNGWHTLLVAKDFNVEARNYALQQGVPPPEELSISTQEPSGHGRSHGGHEYSHEGRGHAHGARIREDRKTAK